MARPLRIEFAGALYHVMARGNAREAMFLDDEDRQRFIDNLDRVCGRFHWRVWAWCLMSNHYHLLIETLEPTLSKGMREVNGIYTQAFNRNHGRVGHVLEGRYKAQLVDQEAYLLELSRYVVLNPVRAKMVESAADWAWSSYLGVMGKAQAIEALAVEQTLSLFHTQRGAARRAFARFIAQGVNAPDPKEYSTAAGLIGDESFVARIQNKVDQHAFGPEIARKSRPALSMTTIQDQAINRNEAIKQAYATTAYSLTEIADHFGLHLSTVSRIARGSDAKNKT